MPSANNPPSYDQMRGDSARTGRRPRIRRKLGKLLKLEPSDWGILVRAVYLLALLELLQNRMSLPRLVAQFDAKSGHKMPSIPPQRLIRLIDGLLSVIYQKDHCMERSFILFHFLRRFGEPAVLCFGVQRSGRRLDGHAWIELDGRPFFEPADPRRTYTTTYVYPMI